MTTSTAKKGFNLGSNPVITKLYDKAESSKASDTASYAGIAAKTSYFLLMALAGFAAFFVLHMILGGGANADFQYNINEFFRMDMYLPEVALAGTALVVSLFAPLAAWFFRPLIPVVGTIYALCEGYTIGFLTGMLTPAYQWISAAALVITVLIVGVMLFLYTKRIVRVGQKFRTVISTVFITVILGGILFGILSFIPLTSALLAPVYSFMGNPLVSIGASLLFLIVAALFLLADFSMIEECIEKGISRKYEWMAAFGLAYTIIYIYFRVLDLIIKVLSLAKSN